MKRTLTSVLIALALATAGITLAPVAAAHSELVSSDPANGAVLDAPPTVVSFTFNEALMPDFVRFIATDPSGQTGDLPVASVDGPTATIQWPQDAPGGEWRVNYRVVSQDGHPIEGGITFAYAAASPSPSVTSSSPTPSPMSSSAAPTSAAPTSAQPSPSTSPAAQSSGSTSGLFIAGLVIALIVVVGVVIALVARRRA